MRDIFFYWAGQEPKHKYDGVRKQFPFAKFVKLNKNPVNTAKGIAKRSMTKDFWLIDIELTIPKTLVDFEVPEWDQQYVHVFKNDLLSAYLINKSYVYDNEEVVLGHFTNKKIFETVDVTYKPYDIFFLSYDEEAADANWQTLLSSHAHADRVHGVKGIFNAHLIAAQKSTTDFFWVVDADAKIRPSFKFDYRVPDWDFDVVHIWNSRNAVNGLEYGYGGVKLIPKFMLLMRANTNAVDVTTSIGSKIKLFDQVSNINDFATSQFNAWRGGFREAVKLSSSIIKRQNAQETATRLEAWCNINKNHEYGSFVIDGARLGKIYGTKNQHDQDQLALINNYEWLYSKFQEYLEFKRLGLKPSEIPRR